MARRSALLPLSLVILLLAACGGSGSSAVPPITLPLPSGTFDTSKIETCDLLSENEASAATAPARVTKQLPARVTPDGTAKGCYFEGDTQTGLTGQPVTNEVFVGFPVKQQTLDEFNSVYGQPVRSGCVVAPVQASQFQTSAQAAYTQLCPDYPQTGNVFVWVNGASLIVLVTSATQTNQSLLPSAINLAGLAAQQAVTNAQLPSPSAS